MNKKRIFNILFVVFLAAFAYTGCSKNDDNSDFISDNREEHGSGNSADAITQYCLACHKGTYEAFADSTIELYGEDNWLNPHRSAHGTNIPCRSCHEEDETAQQDTRCSDKTVKISTACSDFCHVQFTLPNPYPDYK